MSAQWRIQLFGGLCASQGDRVVRRFRSQKTGALLAYLAYHAHRTHARQVLIEMLWPYCLPERGRDSLSTALGALRRELELPGGTDLFRADRTSVGIDPDAVTTDVAEFEARLRPSTFESCPTARAQSLEEAMELYSGPLLPGYYERWILPEQQRLEALFFRAIRQLIAHFEQSGDLERAMEYARRAIAVDPLREEAHQTMIRLHLKAGHCCAAVRHYREFERALKQELHMRPGAATRALIETLAQPGSSP